MSSSPLRVLHIAERLSSRGGADWHLLGVLEHQSACLNHEIQLAVGWDDGTAARACPPTYPVSILPGLDGAEADIPGLGRLLDEFRPDVLHLHSVQEPTVLRWAAACSVPAVATVQDHRPFCPGRGKVTLDDRRCVLSLDDERCRACFATPEAYERRRAMTLARLDALRALRLVVLSQYMKGELIAAGVPAERVHVVPPFVHRLPPVAPAPRDCVLCAGRLVHAKGVFDAVEAHRRSGVELPLVFAGTGSLRNELEGMGHRVTGWLSHEELVGWYARAAALIFAPRWQEPFGIAGLEAMRCGTPVVSWDNGGIPEWHPGTPPLAPWGDVDALAEALAAAVAQDFRWEDPYRPSELMPLLDDVYRRDL